MIDLKCRTCGAKRLEGWLLFKGQCVRCNPEGPKARKAELREQARKLLDMAEGEGA